MKKPNKNLAYEPKTIGEAIEILEIFLEEDLYSKFRPDEKLLTGKNGRLQTWTREDFFKNEDEFISYIRLHFKIFEEQIKKIKEK